MCGMRGSALLVLEEILTLFVGDDHLGKFDWVTEATGGRCSVKYPDRTPSVSTTAIIEKAASIG